MWLVWIVVSIIVASVGWLVLITTCIRDKDAARRYDKW